MNKHELKQAITRLLNTDTPKTKKVKLKRRMLPKEELEARNLSIAKDYNNDIPVKDIEVKYGISRQAIYNVLNKIRIE